MDKNIFRNAFEGMDAEALLNEVAPVVRSFSRQVNEISSVNPREAAILMLAYFLVGATMGTDLIGRGTMDILYERTDTTEREA
jgi:hypothetical protein